MKDRGTLRITLTAILLVSLPANPVHALEPSGAPGQNFDLSHWELTLPVDSSGGTNGTAYVIESPLLVAGYTNASFFFTGADGSMNFKCPANGATTTGSDRPRTELREMLDPSDHAVDWPTRGMHVLTGSCKVTSIPSGAELAIAQVHGYNVNIPLVILRYDNSVSPGLVGATVKYNVANLPVNGSTDNLLLFTNVPLNVMINFKVVLSNGVVVITVNGVTRTQNIFATDTNWAGVNCYFKAGNYYLDNAGRSGSTQVAFHALSTSHQPCIDRITRSGTNLIYEGGGGLAGGGYYVLMATNSALPFAAWTPILTNSFDATGGFRFTNSISQAQRRYFILRLQ